MAYAGAPTQMIHSIPSATQESIHLYHSLSHKLSRTFEPEIPHASQCKIKFLKVKHEPAILACTESEEPSIAQEGEEPLNQLEAASGCELTLSLRPSESDPVIEKIANAILEMGECGFNK